MEDMYCDSDDNNVIIIHCDRTRSSTCQADVDIKMTVGMFMCMTQNRKCWYDDVPICNDYRLVGRRWALTLLLLCEMSQ